jgi:ADP-heptose:LPS heptosyltransferase
MRKFLIVQLTRMGDTLQSTPLLAGLKQKYPDCSISLYIIRSAANVLEGNPHVDEMIYFDPGEMLNDLMLDDSAGLLNCYSKLKRVIETLRDKRFDTIINLSHSKFSALLLRLIPCDDVRGLTLADDWLRVIRGAWPNYFINSVFNRAYNRFNMVDVYRKFGGELPPHTRLDLHVDEEAHRYARELLEQEGIAEGDFVVCMQPGASDEAKRWPEQRFAELADMLIREQDAKVVLLGTDEERPVGEKIVAAMRETPVDTFGRSNIPQLAAILDRADFLVTNDTGVMHVAATTSTTIIDLCFSNVYFRETGPYGDGHFAVQSRIDCTPCRMTFKCHDRVCKNYITAQDVARLIALARRHPDGELRQIEDAPELARVNYFISRFGDDGMVEYVPLIRRPLIPDDAINMAYSAMWKEFLDEHGSAEDDERDFRRLLDYYSGQDSVQQELESAASAFSELAAIADDGVKKAEELLTGLSRPNVNYSRLRPLVGELARVDDGIRVAGRTRETLLPLTSLFSFEKENLEGDDPKLLAQDTLRLYADMLRRCRLIQRKIGTLSGILGE